MKSLFKLLTFTICITLLSSNIFAAVVSQEEFKTHIRWKVKVKKEQINISKVSNTVTFKSLDPEFFEKFSADIAKLKKNSNYHQKFKFSRATSPGDPYSLSVTLKDDSIELFSFFKQDKQEYILDFWVNQDVVATKKSAIVNKPKVVKVAKLKPKKKKRVVKKDKNIEKTLKADKQDKFKVINPETIMKGPDKSKYRDFRYGAAFVWDYKPLIPHLERDIDLNVKGPDFLYEVKDRLNLEDPKSAHMQLSINFYKKHQWGLMTRSINLYEEKYGKEDRYKPLNDFMKAVSMIKNTIKEKVKPTYADKMTEEGDPVPADEFSSKGILAAARNLLMNVVDGTQDYQMAQATLRYQIQYSRNMDDFVNALEHAKNLYVKASKASDDNNIIYASRVILFSLAKLKQMDKIEEFLKNNAVIRVLPKQEGLAYKTYVNLHNDNTKQVLALYKGSIGSMTKPIHPSILFNTAESYFRTAQYNKAIKLFDEFISEYSYISQSGHARLRLALAYDLSGKDYAKILKLYKDAINKTSILDVRYEAKTRYVGLRVARNKKLQELDKETISFLEATVSEKRSMTNEHKKLLWLTRLRALINTYEFEDALAYLSTVPLDTLRLVEKRTFEADGAEVVLGIIQKAYLKGDFGRAVKVWELYKDKYENKVAKNPYMNFIVADSFLQLGLAQSYERSIKNLKANTKTRVRAFPRWVNPHKSISIENYLVELQISKYIKGNDFEGLGAYLKTQKKNKSINYKFYNGLVSHKLKKYNEAVASFESLLVRQNSNNILTPDQSLTMLESYLESLYQVAPSQRFRKNASALSNDLRRQETPKAKQVVKRSDYLYVESLFSDPKPNYKVLVNKASEFVSENKESEYSDRVTYIKAVALIKNQQRDEGKKILNDLISNEGVPEYLKGLARSELSTLVLEEKTI